MSNVLTTVVPVCEPNLVSITIWQDFRLRIY